MTEPSPAVRALIQQLLVQATTQSATVTPVPGPAHVLLDLAVDGVRCVLTREPEPVHASTTLSKREVEIARLIALGMPNKVIAARLQISAWTVCTHLRRAFNKLGVTSRAAMIAKMAQGGMLEHRA